MCGFTVLTEPGRVFPPALLEIISGDLHHRGPDSGGIHAEPGVAMVFRRLAIIDPRPDSDQPMHDAEAGITLVFNGEIYNYRALRRALEAVGQTFRTLGDTEVILAGYRHWGDGVFARLEGMFAVCLLDRRRGVLVAARDPFGIKPLYMLQKAAMIGFSSEIRPFARLTPLRPDPVALAELLTFRFAAGSLSNVAGVEKVVGGTLVTVSLADGRSERRRFADPLETLHPDESMTDAEALDMAEEAVVTSLKAHLQSDVGYAVQLSGGVDSSLVAALAQQQGSVPLKSFAVALKGLKEDEGVYRQPVVERYGLDHHEVALTGVDFADALPRAVAHMEGPVPHYGCVMLMLLCDRIRAHTKVVLTGEGADEMFGGYMRYGLWKALRKKGRAAALVPAMLWPFLQRYREVQRYSAGRDPSVWGAVYHDFLTLFELFPDLMPRPGAREAAAARFPDFRDRMIAVDQMSYLESLLMRQDKMAMAASVETRVPFTHMPVARVLNRLPRRLRFAAGETKPLLKRIADKHLPHEVVHRRKVGLSLPLNDWLRDEAALGRYLDSLTAADGRLAEHAGSGAMARVVEEFRAGRTARNFPTAHLVNVEMWLRSFDDLPPVFAA